MDSSTEFKDWSKLWDFENPELSRQRFKSLQDELALPNSHPYNLELITQIARTYSLEGEFDLGHKLLDKFASEFQESNSKVKVHFHLEKGRLYNSNGELENALDHFCRAWDLANSNGIEVLSIDAAHMMAIVKTDPEEALKWNLIALEIAEHATSPRGKKWLGALANNTGWTYFDKEDYDTALIYFEKALTNYQEYGTDNQLRIARWTIGRVYREIGKTSEALEIMQQLEAEAKQEDRSINGYTAEELAELYLLQKESNKAQSYFQMAYDLLSKDDWLVRNEPERVARLLELSQ